jgi:hypothetical protein
MKKIIITLALAIICIQTKAQSTYPNTIAYVSPKKDTLMLPNDDFGKLVASTWIDTPIKSRPVILLVTEDTIKQKNEELYLKRKKKPLIKK